TASSAREIPPASGSSGRGFCRCPSVMSSGWNYREPSAALLVPWRRKSGNQGLMAALRPEDVPFWPWGVLLMAVGLYLVGVAALIAAGRREDARALAGFIPDCTVLISRLARDKRIPARRLAVLFVVLGYLALPFDLVPDFLPGIGRLDDAVVLGFALRFVVRGGGSER